MTQPTILSYDELTWPEVAALPRDTPLILPLGSGYDLMKLADALGNPAQMALLPPLPFGWRGSGLAVPESVVGRMVAHLLDSLHDDGFSRVFAMTPQGIDLGLGTQRITLPYLAQQAPLPPDSEREKVVLIPIGHTEQHGYHLPLATDTLIIGSIGENTAVSSPDLTTCLPVFPYGVSTHRQAFAGTMNCGGRPFEDFHLNHGQDDFNQ